MPLPLDSPPPPSWDSALVGPDESLSEQLLLAVWPQTFPVVSRSSWEKGLNFNLVLQASQTWTIAPGSLLQTSLLPQPHPGSLAEHSVERAFLKGVSPQQSLILLWRVYKTVTFSFLVSVQTCVQYQPYTGSSSETFISPWRLVSPRRHLFRSRDKFGCAAEEKGGSHWAPSRAASARVTPLQTDPEWSRL